MSYASFALRSRATAIQRLGAPSSDAGFILPVALFILVAATMLTLSLVKTNMSSLRIGGASVIAKEAQTSAELILANFFTRNPIVTRDPATGKELPDAGRYERGNTPCSVTADDPDADSTIFDCRSIASARLPAHTTQVFWAPGVNTPEVQRIGCGMAPRSDNPTQNDGKIKFNNNMIVTRVENTFYGSRATVGTGVGKLVVLCP